MHLYKWLLANRDEQQLLLYSTSHYCTYTQQRKEATVKIEIELARFWKVSFTATQAPTLHFRPTLSLP